MKSNNEKFLLLALFLFFSVCSIKAQTPVIEWQRSLGGVNGDYATSVKHTTDGGYIIAGNSEGPDGGDIMGSFHNGIATQIWIVKLSAVGTIQWQKCIGGRQFTTGAYLQLTNDGGFVIAGSSALNNCGVINNHNSLDFYIAKLTANGDIEWQKSYGGTKNEYAYGISLTSDGGYVISGQTESNDADVTGNHGMLDFWVIKLNSQGKLLWQNSLGGSADDVSYAVQATADGGCVAAGFSESSDGDVTGNRGLRDFWIVKLDNAGNLEWQRNAGGSQYDEAWGIELADDGGYIATGLTSSGDGDVLGNHQTIGLFSDAWVVKFDKTGNIAWQKCYGGDLNEQAYSIKATPDNGYIVTGNSSSTNADVSCNAGYEDGWVFKIDKAGQLLWQRSLGGSGTDLLSSAEGLPDGSCVVVGFVCSPDILGYHPHNTSEGTCTDFLVVKLSKPLDIIPAPVVSISPSQANVCLGSPASFIASVSYAGINPSFQWEKNGIPAGENAATYTEAAYAAGDKIVCRITSGGTCDQTISGVSNTVVISPNVNSTRPAIAISADNTALCDCQPVNFKATVTNGGGSPTYVWKVNGKSTSTYGNVFTSNLLNDQDIIICEYRDNTMCLADGSATSNSVQVKKAANAIPTITIQTNSAQICEGASVTFSATTENAGTHPVYQWQVNGINQGTDSSSFTMKTIVDNDIVSCKVIADPISSCAQSPHATSNSITLYVIPKKTPSVTIVASDTIVCKGATVTFIASANDAGNNPSFQWKINGKDISAAKKDIFVTSTLADGDIVECTLQTDPGLTCLLSTQVNSNKIALRLKNEQEASVTISATPSSFCEGTVATFRASVENAGLSPSYLWKVNNVTIGDNTSTYSSRNLMKGDKIWCMVIPGQGACSATAVSSDTLLPEVYQIPQVSIIPADTTVLPYSQVAFRAVNSGDIASFRWEPASKLEDPASAMPVTIPLHESVRFSLTVTDLHGCHAVAYSDIKVYRTFYMPSAFSPNGDGLNDIFRIPRYTLLKLKEFSIFDRWGTKIFSTNDISMGWDGRKEGRKAGTGVYVYFVNGEDNEGNHILKKGTLTLMQ